MSVQASHAIPAHGYHPPYVRTGFESVIPERMSKVFAYCAKEDGIVQKVTDKGVVIEYKSGHEVGLATGRHFGHAEGTYFPFDIESLVKEGQKFKKGDPLIYNTNYFQLDPWNPGHLVLKNSLTARVVLWETKQTHEDASSISESLAQKLGTRVTYIRSFVVNFEQGIHNVAEVDSTVRPNQILMTIEDEITSKIGSFSKSSIQTLKHLARQSPKSNHFGTIDRIEVFYYGDKDDMSKSLRELADQSDKWLSEHGKVTRQPKLSGEVTEDYRVEGTPLGLNKAEIRFYITTPLKMGVADKVVFANQMKSVNSEVMPYQLFTEHGEPIEAAFGAKSIAARKVLSCYLLGTTTTLLKRFAQDAVKLYNT